MPVEQTLLRQLLPLGFSVVPSQHRSVLKAPPGPWLGLHHLGAPSPAALFARTAERPRQLGANAEDPVAAGAAIASMADASEP